MHTTVPSQRGLGNATEDQIGKASMTRGLGMAAVGVAPWATRPASSAPPSLNTRSGRRSGGSGPAPKVSSPPSKLKSAPPSGPPAPTPATACSPGCATTTITDCTQRSATTPQPKPEPTTLTPQLPENPVSAPPGQLQAAVRTVPLRGRLWPGRVALPRFSGPWRVECQAGCCCSWSLHTRLA